MGVYNIQSIREAYFGETKEIRSLQKHLSDFRARCIKEEKFTKAENTYDEVIKFNREMEKVFGFETFSIQVIMDSSINAFTMPISSKLDVYTSKKNTKITKNSVKFDKEAGYSCMLGITYPLLVSQRFTDREVMAIILHEIGHNFSEVLNKGGTVFGNYMKFMSFYYILYDAILAVLENPIHGISAISNSLYSFNSIQKVVLNVYEKIRVDKNAKQLIVINNTIEMLQSNINSFIYQIFSNIAFVKILIEPSRYMLLIIKKILAYEPLSVVRSLLGYNEEKAADTLPSIYGYGVDISSALAKLEYGSYNKDKNRIIPIFTHLQNIMILPLTILSMGLIAHPATVARIKEQIKYLEREISKESMDPKMKKEIQNQISKMNKTIDKDILESARRMDIKDPGLVNKIYVYCIYHICGGDIKEIFIKNKNAEYIDCTFEEKIKMVEIK